jgi:hypothetical protein
MRLEGSTLGTGLDVYFEIQTFFTFVIKIWYSSLSRNK